MVMVIIYASISLVQLVSACQRNTYYARPQDEYNIIIHDTMSFINIFLGQSSQVFETRLRWVELTCTLILTGGRSGICSIGKKTKMADKQILLFGYKTPKTGYNPSRRMKFPVQYLDRCFLLLTNNWFSLFNLTLA